jgi:hypothetical protein
MGTIKESGMQRKDLNVTILLDDIYVHLRFFFAFGFSSIVRILFSVLGEQGADCIVASTRLCLEHFFW